MSGVPYTFGNATTSIPLSQLDVNFATNATIGTTSVGLGNTTTTLVGLTNVSTTVVNASNVASNTSLLLQTNGTTTGVTIDTSQNVGIGTTSPSTKLNIVQNQNGASQVLLSNNTGGASSQVIFSATDGTNYGQFGMWGSGVSASGAQQPSNAFVYGSGGISYFTGGTHRWYYSTNTEAMRIDSSGNLLVGVTSTINSSKLTVSNPVNNAANFATASSGNYSLVCQNTGSGSTNFIIFQTGSGTTTVGSITYNGTLTVYGTTSDRRLKSNIVDLTTVDSGALIDSLLPRKFTWTSSGQADIGFIADEVQSVLPGAVSGTANGTKEEEYEITPAVKDEQGTITTPAVMGTRTVPDYQMVDMSIPEMMAYLVAEVKSLRARLKAANIA